MKMHQEMFHHWSHLWPLSMPHSIWFERTRGLQKKWANMVSDLARKHRDVVEKQYQSALETLDAALEVPSATSPEEFRRRTEQLVRKMLDCIRDVSETQVREVQAALAKWTAAATEMGP